MLIVLRMIVWGACLYCAYKALDAMTRPDASAAGVVFGAVGLLVSAVCAMSFYRYEIGMPITQLLPAAIGI